MAATKTQKVFFAAGTSLVPGTPQSSTITTSTGYGGYVAVQLANGSGNPTTAAIAHVGVSGDNTTFISPVRFYSDTISLSVNPYGVDISAGVAYVRVVIDSLGGTVTGTIAGYFYELTTV